MAPARYRPRQRVGKYRIRRRIGEGGFGEVFEAMDTVEGVPVALKVPSTHISPEALEDFRKEIRLNARLDHPNVLPIKNADVIDGQIVVAYPLGETTLAERMQRRMAPETAIAYAEQLLAALAHAHDRHVIHCDVKPENLILFRGRVLRLADFGIARLALRTVQASGSGSLGYIAPEQAMGRPSARSDVFSAGLVIYRLLTGSLPGWPFEWPPPGYERLRRYPAALGRFLRRALEVRPRRRFRDGRAMFGAFRRIKPALVRTDRARAPSRKRQTEKDWRLVRVKQFRRRHGRHFELDHACVRCEHPIDERMRFCPSCGDRRERHDGVTRMPAICPRCRRGVKLDWKFCPWCYGAAIGPATERSYSDKRYTARCTNPRCGRRSLMPFMRYCPWCRRKVVRRFKVGESRKSCAKCGQGIAHGFWHFCAWCGAGIDDG